jgi:hypothetical protein
MIEEKDRYRAPTTRQAARPAAIPAGNLGQKADPTDKSTESLQGGRRVPARGGRNAAGPAVTGARAAPRSSSRSRC